MKEINLNNANKFSSYLTDKSLPQLKDRPVNPPYQVGRCNSNVLRVDVCKGNCGVQISATTRVMLRIFVVFLSLSRKVPGQCLHWTTITSFKFLSNL